MAVRDYSRPRCTDDEEARCLAPLHHHLAVVQLNWNKTAGCLCRCKYKARCFIALHHNLAVAQLNRNRTTGACTSVNIKPDVLYPITIPWPRTILKIFMRHSHQGHWNQNRGWDVGLLCTWQNGWAFTNADENMSIIHVPVLLYTASFFQIPSRTMKNKQNNLLQISFAVTYLIKNVQVYKARCISHWSTSRITGGTHRCTKLGVSFPSCNCMSCSWAYYVLVHYHHRKQTVSLPLHYCSRREYVWVCRGWFWAGEGDWKQTEQKNVEAQVGWIMWNLRI